MFNRQGQPKRHVLLLIARSEWALGMTSDFIFLSEFFCYIDIGLGYSIDKIHPKIRFFDIFLSFLFVNSTFYFIFALKNNSNNIKKNKIVQ